MNIRVLIVLLAITTKSMPAQQVVEDINSVTTRTNQLISQMTLRQKVNELSGRGITRMGLSFLLTKRISPVKFGGNKELGIPAGVFFDGPRGVALYKGATAFPVTSARAAAWDRELEERVGKAMAKENRALGGNYSGAVCINLLRHPANGRAQESYGEDPFLTGEMGVALVQGIQSENVQACVKHFALNSMENNRFGGNVIVDERSLHEVYLPHFRKVIQSGAVSVMSAYNKVNGEYCGENALLLNTILRKEWGFQGYVTSDWSYGLFYAVKGIKAGLNVEMPTAKCYRYRTIRKLIETDQITMDEIDSLVFPVVHAKLMFLDDRNKKLYPKNLLGCQQHVDLSREVAEKSMVLLKNENNVLPLSNKIGSIAIIGSLADYRQTGDHGSSRVLPKYVITLKEAISSYFPDSEILTAKRPDETELLTICGKADAVIVMAGYTFRDEGEYISMGKLRDSLDQDKTDLPVKLGLFGLGGDRKYLHLYQSDIDVIKLASLVNKKVIVCLVGGSAITVEEWYDDVPAILHTFYSGMEGENALAAILSGSVNPSGKLPFTVPVSESDLPGFYSFSSQVTYGYYHGYTLFDKTKRPVRFAFGYGLSYTTFQLSELDILKDTLKENDTLYVTVKLQNTGNRKGEEVVQLYIGFENSAIDRPDKLLRAFEKVELLSGEKKNISLEVPVHDLAYYDDIEKTWKTEKMQYRVLVGNQSGAKDFLQDYFVIK